LDGVRVSWRSLRVGAADSAAGAVSFLAAVGLAAAAGFAVSVFLLDEQPIATDHKAPVISGLLNCMACIGIGRWFFADLAPFE
jgi:hypothetical protein